MCWERWLSGRKRGIANPLYGRKTVPRVRIPPSPPIYAFARASLLATIGFAAGRFTKVCWVDNVARAALPTSLSLRRTGSGDDWLRPPLLTPHPATPSLLATLLAALQRASKILGKKLDGVSYSMRAAMCETSIEYETPSSFLR